MTYDSALTRAINALSASTNPDDLTAIERLTSLRETYSNRNAKRQPMSDEAKAAQSAARKAKTAAARADVVKVVAPILRKYLDTDRTAKELFAVAQAELPADFTAAKVQNVLIREMKPELVRTERKKGGDTYRLM